MLYRVTFQDTWSPQLNPALSFILCFVPFSPSATLAWQFYAWRTGPLPLLLPAHLPQTLPVPNHSWTQKQHGLTVSRSHSDSCKWHVTSAHSCIPLKQRGKMWIKNLAIPHSPYAPPHSLPCRRVLSSQLYILSLSPLHTRARIYTHKCFLKPSYC